MYSLQDYSLAITQQTVHFLIYIHRGINNDIKIFQSHVCLVFIVLDIDVALDYVSQVPRHFHLHLSILFSIVFFSFSSQLVSPSFSIHFSMERRVRRTCWRCRPHSAEWREMMNAQVRWERWNEGAGGWGTWRKDEGMENERLTWCMRDWCGSGSVREQRILTEWVQDFWRAGGTCIQICVQVNTVASL